MSRRKPYSKVKKENQVRADHVRGMGDVVFLGFQCLHAECNQFIFVKKDEVAGDAFEIACPACGHVIYSGGESTFYDYELEVEQDGEKVIKETGQFVVYHDEYIEEAQEYKYCIVCNTLKPLDHFDRHASRNSGRQGECRLCKKIYNSIKNGTRTTDQHRESAQKRRLYIELSGRRKLDSSVVYERFRHRCFKCGEDLSGAGSADKALDHTLPVYYLYPLSTENATLLCRTCNGVKAGSWPSEFYSDQEMKRLAILTGIPYEVMSGPAVYNEEALEKLRDSAVVDALLEKYSKYIGELIKLRNRLLHDLGEDFFAYSQAINPRWVEEADKQYAMKYGG